MSTEPSKRPAWRHLGAIMPVPPRPQNKIELSPWQNPEHGFPSGDYFDAVVVALEEAGRG